MNIRRKKLIRRVIIVLVIFIVAYCLLRTFVIGKPITSFYSNNPQKITKIEIMSGSTGDIKYITSQDQIKTITDYLSTLKFKRRYPPDSSGWAYRITAYADDKELIELTDQGDIYIVNGKKYEVNFSNDTSLNDILDDYMN